MKLFRAELKKIGIIVRSDPRSILAGLIAPSLVLILFSLLFGGLSPFPLGIVNKDAGPWGARLEQEILGQVSPLGDIPYFAKKETEERAAVQAFEGGELAGVLIIPEQFSQRLISRQNPSCTYYLNNYNTDFAKNMRLYLQEGIYGFYKKYYEDVNVEIRETISAPAQVEWVEIIAVGTLLLAFIIGGMFCYLYVFLKEKQYGTLIVYQTAPHDPLASFLARGAAALLSSLLAGLFNALLIYRLLGFNVFDSLPSFMPAVFLTVTIYISCAAVFSLFIDHFYGAIIGSMGGAMVLWFFSGGFHTAVPEQPVLLFIYRILPNSYALDIMREILFGAGQLNIYANYGILLVMTAFSFVWAMILYRSKLGKSPHD